MHHADPTHAPPRHSARFSRRRAIAALLAGLPLLAAPAQATSPAPPTPLTAYAANNPKLLLEFENWLGCKVDFVHIFLDHASWEGIGWPSWFMDQFKELDKPVLWSFAMIPRGATLKDAGSGKYNRYYLSAAKLLAQAKPFPNGTIPIRLGWEFNGTWFAWSARGKEEDFIATYRNVVNAFRSVSDKFRFEWNVNFGQKMDVMKAYPGDEFVDTLGMDFYWKKEWQSHDPVRAFKDIRDHRVGLRWLEDLAKQKGKPTAYSEWGVNGNNAGPFIKLVQEWIAQHPNVAYTTYWNSDADYEGKLSGGRWPDAGNTFKQAFCPAPNGSAQIRR
jgi:hypothetical protein